MRILTLFVLVGLSQAVQALSVRTNIDDIKFTGNIDRESVRRSFSSKTKEFKQCGLVPGQIEVQIVVDQNGQITSLKSKLSPISDPATEKCFDQVAKTLFLPSAEGDKLTTVAATFEIGAEEAASKTAHELEKTESLRATAKATRAEELASQQGEFEKTPQFKMKSACEAYRDLEKVNDESKAKDQQLRKLAYDNAALARVFHFYARQMSGLKNKADAYSEEYQKQSGKALDPKKDCGL